MNPHLSKHDTRVGFTLIELLMVMAIIAILMTMSVVVMRGFLEQAEEEATSATIQKINRMLEQRMEAFDRAFIGAREEMAEQGMLTLLQSKGIYGVSDTAVNILARKALFRLEFPQSFEDVTLYDGVPELVTGLPNNVYYSVCAPRVRKHLNLPDTTPLNDPAIIAQVGADFSRHASVPESESSELLYFMLIASGNLGTSSVDGDRFTNAEIADTDNDGLPEFVDAWGQPLRYYRWPTRLVDTNPMAPVFQPDLMNLADQTDLDMTPDNNDADGLREVTSLERGVANMLLKGLPPQPAVLPNGAVPRDLLLIDPDDPVGILYAELERLNGANGKPVLATEFNEANYHTPDTFHAPLVLSIGPDEMLGLFEPYDIANLGNLAAYNSTLSNAQILDAIADNITSRNKLAGGRP